MKPPLLSSRLEPCVICDQQHCQWQGMALVVVVAFVYKRMRSPQAFEYPKRPFRRLDEEVR